MKTKIQLLEKNLLVFIFVVLMFGMYLQIVAENDGKLNHAVSYCKLDIPVHSWVAYAFWVATDVESYKYEAEWDPNQRLSSADWISRITFFILFIAYCIIYVLYRSSKKKAFILILFTANIWLFVETIWLISRGVLL